MSRDQFFYGFQNAKEKWSFQGIVMKLKIPVLWNIACVMMKSLNSCI